jgi:cell wall-associated NlpC family hydrolase
MHGEKLDPHLHAFREDLADVCLRDRVFATRYVEGRIATVNVGLAPVHSQADSSMEVCTHYTYNEKILVFDDTETYLWCRSLSDNYVGYVAVGNVDFSARSSPTHFISTMGSYVYPAPDLRTPAVDFFPRHTPVTVLRDGVITRDTRYVELTGSLYILENCLSTSPARSDDIVLAASRYLETPYLWGGKSCLGIDCAALVQNCCKDIGYSVLRDTYMQCDTIGYPVEIEYETDLQRGDLLYIPGHVMIYAGDGDIIHANAETMSVTKEKLVGFCSRRNLRLDTISVRRIR